MELGTLFGCRPLAARSPRSQNSSSPSPPPPPPPDFYPTLAFLAFTAIALALISIAGAAQGLKIDGAKYF